jgi:lysosomal alpha-mannosidase
LHRRTFLDDGRGVGEPLNELGLDGHGLVARGRHWLLLTSVAEAATLHRPLAQRLFYTPLLKFASFTTVETYRADMNTQVKNVPLS